MADTLNDFLAGPVLTELAQSEQIKTGLPMHFDPAFMKPGASRPVGLEVVYTAFKGTRAMAQLVQQDSPSVTVTVPGARKITVTGLGTKENFPLNGQMLMNLKSPIPFIATQAKAEFLRNMINFGSRRDSMKRSLVASAIYRGKIGYKLTTNGTGTQLTLPTTSGATTVDYSPTALAQGVNNLTVANDDGSSTTYTGLITVPDFNSAGTDIPSFFRNLQQVYEQVTGYQAYNISYGKNIPGYLGTTNTAMQAYWSRNQRLNDKFMDTNEVPDRLFDYKWTPAYRQYFQDLLNSNAATAWIPDDAIVLTPAPDDSWYEFIECGSPVPTGMGVLTGDLDAMISQFTNIAFGDYSYCYGSVDPLVLRQVNGWYGIPVVKNGLAQWIITTH